MPGGHNAHLLDVEHAARSVCRAGGFEKSEHGHDPAIQLPFLDEAKLLEDRADVLLDRAVTHVEGFGDGVVVPPSRHLLEHLTLTVGQTEQRRRLFVRLAGEQRFDHLGVEGGPAAGHLPQRPHQLVAISHALLQQVPEPAHPVLE
jgi:hypothetical protein